MVACNQEQNECLVFLRVSLDILALPGVVISNGNARSGGTKFFPFWSIEDLNVIDPKAINTVKVNRGWYFLAPERSPEAS